MENQHNNQNKTDFKKIFNLNNILSTIVNLAAYIILIASFCILLYISFIKTFNIKIDWLTLTIFSVAVVSLSWINWTNFYKKRFEKVMGDDIIQNEKGKYSIHARYYYAIKDYTDAELQEKIDAFNDEYTKRWLNWVEKHTGIPVETTKIYVLDEDGNKQVDSEGKYITKTITGIKDLPYRGFKHKIIMWQIKTHHYPQSGYKTSMELMSLFAFQDSNLNKRKLKAYKNYYRLKAISKLFTSFMAIIATASVIPEMISGEYWSAILKLLIGIFALLSSVIFGALNGIHGARLKLSTVEEVCEDLERWKTIKPKIAPFKINEDIKEPEPEQLNIFDTQNDNTNDTNNITDNTTEETNNSLTISYNIFDKLKLPNK